MLVLSRRETDKVVFPTLGVSVEVLRIRGNVAKLGIDAPPEIPVLRHELTKQKSVDLTPDATSTRAQLRELAHVVRRRLDSASQALNRLHETLDETCDVTAQKIVMQLYQELQQLEHEANDALEWSSEAKSTRVLVVEDSAMERKLLTSVLELSGLDVTSTNDGQDALEFLSLHSAPDAVLLDMVMPRCDGPGFVQKVRANPNYQGLKIFAMSSIDPSTLGLVTGDGGIDGWFPKPLDPNELVSVLTQHVTGPLAA
jgi:carbon storage regulator CsrA